MDRRTFLTSTASTTMMALAPTATSSPAQDHRAANAGLTKSTIPTPALVVDLDAFETNLKRMAEHCQQAGVRFRPHAKTHKCPEIARRQIAHGAIGICCATVPEAEALVAAGIPGVLLTSPILDPLKVARLVKLARQGTGVMAAVGSRQQGQLLAEACAAAEVNLDVLIDLDIGDRRTGSLPGEPAVELARALAKSPRLRVRGVQAYAGHASHVVGFEERQRVSRTALAKAVDTKLLLAKAGFEATILSGGSTGTYNIDSQISGMTELQVGSYIFMDVDYRRIGSRSGDTVYQDFLPSLTILTTVVNATHPDRVTIDAGTKAIDATTTHRAEPKNWPGLLYSKAGDEFGAVSWEGPVPKPELGQRLEFFVPHCDPNVNLYSRLYACRGDRVEEVWGIEGRN